LFFRPAAGWQVVFHEEGVASFGGERACPNALPLAGWGSRVASLPVRFEALIAVAPRYCSLSSENQRFPGVSGSEIRDLRKSEALPV